MITIMEEEEMRRAVRRLAIEAAEKCGGCDFVLVGIRKRGAVLAERMQRELKLLEGAEVPAGVLDFLPDDSGAEGDALGGLTFPVAGKNVVLCDDVLYTGNTVRAALSVLAGEGKAASVKLFCLVDRGHRLLPFRADGVGKNVPTSRRERLIVCFKETDGREGIYLLKEGEEITEV